MASEAEILVPSSIGELVDKITILEIKRDRIGEPAKRANVVNELERLLEVASGHGLTELVGGAEAAALREVNTRLWDVEDDIRRKESQADFGAQFVALARSVYTLNDERARLKRAINIAAGSRYVEEKSFD